jgi:hypothetical protein
METFFEFLAYLVQVIFWWLILQAIFSALLRIRENKRENIQNLVAKLDEITHRVSVEKHGDMYYWFDSDDHEFLAQGKGIDETVDVLKKRFPNHIFFLATADSKYKISGPDWKLEPINI